MAGASSEEDGPEDSVMTKEASEDGKEYTTCLSDWRRQLRKRPLDARLERYPTMTSASAEKDSNYDRGVCGGREVDTASEGLDTMMEVAAARRRAQRIYDANGGVGGWRRA